MNPLRTARRLALAGITVVLVAACSGTTSPSPTTGPSTSATGAAPSTAESQAPSIGGTIKVGFADVLSGPIGYLGTYQLNSLTVEADRINAAGGILGAKIEISSRDTQANPQKVTEAVRALTSGSDKVDFLVGPGFTGLFLAAKPVIEQAGLPNCLSLVSGNIGTVATSFRTIDPDELRTKVLMKFIADQKLATKIGMVYENDATGQGYDKVLPGLATEDGLSWVGTEYNKADSTSHVDQVRALIAKGADGIVISSNAPQAALSALAVQQLGAGDKVKLFGFSGLRAASYAQIAKEAALGTYLIAGFTGFQTDQDPSTWPAAYKAHIDAVVAKYGVDTTPDTGTKVPKGTPEAATCMTLYSMAVTKAGSKDPKAVLGAWETLNVKADELPQPVNASFSADDHELYGPNDFYIYKWAKASDGTYLLNQASGPTQ